MHQNVFASDDALIGNGKTDFNFYYVHLNFLYCVIQTLDEVASAERIKTQYISNYSRARK